MSHIFKVFILCICVYTISCASTKTLQIQQALDQKDIDKKLIELQEKLKNGKLENSDDLIPSSFVERITKFIKTEVLHEKPANKEDLSEPKTNLTSLERQKRQPDLYNYYDSVYPTDFLYDYYDWVCSEAGCQLCNVLTSQCCNPVPIANCRLPDSCLNNPCLSGGTCVPTLTPAPTNPASAVTFPDFICVCLPGFTGKYCQLTNDYMWPPGFGGDSGPGGPGPSKPKKKNINNNSGGRG